MGTRRTRPLPRLRTLLRRRPSCSRTTIWKTPTSWSAACTSSFPCSTGLTRTRRSSRSLPRSPRRRKRSRTRTTPTTRRKRVMTTTIPPERRPSFRQPLVELFLRGLAELSRSAPQLVTRNPLHSPLRRAFSFFSGTSGEEGEPLRCAATSTASFKKSKLNCERGEKKCILDRVDVPPRAIQLGEEARRADPAPTLHSERGHGELFRCPHPPFFVELSHRSDPGRVAATLVPPNEYLRPWLERP